MNFLLLNMKRGKGSKDLHFDFINDRYIDVRPREHFLKNAEKASKKLKENKGAKILKRKRKKRVRKSQIIKNKILI